MHRMINRKVIWVLLVQAFLTATSPVSRELSLREIAKIYTRYTPSGIHLPIVRIDSEQPTDFEKRSSVGLGDSYDSVYSVLVTVGNVTAPLILDTGSSDLWMLSDDCTEGCRGVADLYPQASLQSAGIDIRLDYGDSQTRTFASGLIAYDNVSVAGVKHSTQAFAAMNRTNTIGQGLSGILGINFPLVSIIWGSLFSHNLNKTSSARRSADGGDPFFHSSFPATYDWRRRTFPLVHDIHGALLSPPRHESRQTGPSPATVKAALDSWSNNWSPFVPRLITNGILSQPLVVVALQRDSVDIGSGNQGLLSIGEFPPGVNSSDLTWADLRGYTTDQMGIPGPPDSPSEVYPYTWEIKIDNVYLDGVKLPTTNATPDSIGITALLDTGNSLIRGPEDSILYINQRLAGTFQCAEPHNLSFEIGGKIFPVDPRDFLRQASTNSLDNCTANLEVTDSPKVGGFLYSWSLGTPFLKGVLSAYYFGNITYPSRDPPRVGLLSTVPSNASELLKAAVASATRAGHLLGTTQSAPAATSISR